MPRFLLGPDVKSHLVELPLDPTCVCQGFSSVQRIVNFGKKTSTTATPQTSSSSFFTLSFHCFVSLPRRRKRASSSRPPVPKLQMATESKDIFCVRTYHKTPTQFPTIQHISDQTVSSAFTVLQIYCTSSKKQSLVVRPFRKEDWMNSFRAASFTSSNFAWTLVWSVKVLLLHRWCRKPQQALMPQGTSIPHSRSCLFQKLYRQVI